MTVHTIAEIDTAMNSARLAYAEAIDSGDLERADLKYAEMDGLLDERVHHKAEH